MKIVNAKIRNDNFNWKLLITYEVQYKTKKYAKQVILERSKETNYKIKRTSIQIKPSTIYL